ncbi:MAG: hypothetical protein ABFD52_05465 [Acidobacteriota bacterium]
MRQNIGLLCLTAGSILLSVNVFWGKYVSDWKGLPPEQRFFYKLTGGKKLFDFEARAKELEIVNRMQKDPVFWKLMENRAKWRRRVVGDLPILAILLMLIGFFLSLR